MCIMLQLESKYRVKEEDGEGAILSVSGSAPLFSKDRRGLFCSLLLFSGLCTAYCI